MNKVGTYRAVKIELKDGTEGYSVQLWNSMFWVWALTNWDCYTSGRECDYKPYDFDTKEEAQNWISKRLRNVSEQRSYSIKDLNPI